MTSTIPTPHKTILDSIIGSVQKDDRLNAILAGGSLLHGGFDECSDLDLIIVAKDADYQAVMATRRMFAESCGDLLAAFSGEHVGEPRLLICLYGPDAIHVDLKFVTADSFRALIERPILLWSDDPETESLINRADVKWPNQPLEWFEERFWIWVHYGATKIARGEYFEAMGMLSFLREQVLGPLIHETEGRLQRGVRRLEAASPSQSKALEATLAQHNRESVLTALTASIAMYETLTVQNENRSAARDVVLRFIGEL
ncbi:MAG: nucleotidyltransferase domain-containing protein [Pseudomonadota bacterium]